MKKVNISTALKNSAKWQNAVEERRIGARSHKEGTLSNDTRARIKNSVIEYYNANRIDIINNHREIMTRIKGKKVTQYTEDNIPVKEYNSISEAGRISGINRKNIQQTLSGRTKTAGGYIWKYVD